MYCNMPLDVCHAHECQELVQEFSDILCVAMIVVAMWCRQ
jgi:hypothetical protein